MNNFNQYQQMQMGRPNMVNGTMYNPEPKRKRILTNPISQEKQKELMNKQTQFTLQVTDAEMNSAICTHKNTMNQTFAIRPLGDGRVQCDICGAIMNPNVVDVESAKIICEQMENILQVAKLMDVNLDPEVVKQFYAMIAFIRKSPGLLDLSIKSYDKYIAESQGIGVDTNYDATNNTMNILNNILGFGYGNGAPYPYGTPSQMNQQQNQSMVNNMGYPINPYMNMQNMGAQMNNGSPIGNPFYANPNMTQNVQQVSNPNMQTTNNAVSTVDIPVPRTSQAAKNVASQQVPAPSPDVVSKTGNYTI